MGRERNRQNAPGLFGREGAASAIQSAELREALLRKWALPKDLGKALQFLDDEQIDRLLKAASE
jgi:HD-like signal output (HDOD) protein